MDQAFLIDSLPACTYQAVITSDSLDKGTLLTAPGQWRCEHSFISQQGEEITGYTVEDLLSHPEPAFHALCIPEDRPRLLELFEAARTKNAAYQIKYRIQRSDGTIRWVQEHGDFDPIPPNVNLVATVNDCTIEEVLKEELIHRQDLLSAIAEASSLLINETDLFKALNKAAERVGKSTGVDRVYLFVNTLDAADQAVTTSQQMEWNSGQAIPQINNPDLQDVPISDFGVFMEPLKQQRPFQAVVEEIEDDYVRGFLAAQDIRSILVLPITVEGNFWGFLGFDQCTHVRSWSKEEEQILRTLCSAMAGAVVRNSMAREIELDLKAEQAINKATARLMPLTEPGEVYWTALEELPNELSFSDCVIYAYTPHLHELKLVAARNEELDHARIANLPDTIVLGEGIIGKAAKTRDSICVNDIKRSHEFRPFMNSASSAMAVPIMADGRLFGVIGSRHSNPHHFNSKHERFLKLLSGIIAVKLLQAEQFKSALAHEQMANDLQVRLNQELERSLHQRELQLEEITAISRFPEVSPLPVIRVDASGKLTYANPASAPLIKAWGLALDEHVPQNLLVQIRWAANRKATFNQAADDKLFKVMASTVDGFDFLNVYATNETAIHELRRLQEEMINQERMSVLGQLMAGIAHELNTPLGAISGSIRNLTRIAEKWFQNDLVKLNLDDVPVINLHAARSTPDASNHYTRQKALTAILAEHYPDLRPSHRWAEKLADIGWGVPLDAEQEALLMHPRALDIIGTVYTIASIANAARIIHFASERSGRIIKALRNYTHKDHKEVPVLIDLQRQITDIQQLFATGVRKGISFAVRSDGPLFIKGHEDQLSHVWTNLYNNAIQAMGSKGNLVVSIAQESDHVLVRFTNDGPMIPLEVQPKIFEPMFTTKARGEGTGMGLSIARSIAQEHGGDITCISNPTDTTFIVSLPISKTLKD
jgi:two-component system NtrC family sensor kinase